MVIMKRIKNFFLTVLICFVFAGNINTFAMETGFLTEEMTQDEIERFFNNGNITMFTSEPIKDEIVCFDVSDDGMIAIGTENGDEKKSVYILMMVISNMDIDSMIMEVLRLS